jgi:hypothetical protein
VSTPLGSDSPSRDGAAGVRAAGCHRVAYGRTRSPRRRRLAIVPLFAGLLPVLVDDRRRGLHDLIAGTIVPYSEEEPPAEPLPARTTVRSDPPTRAVFHEP